MDGNGRWVVRRGTPAEDRRPSRGRPRGQAHHTGSDGKRCLLVTLYAFSSENWRRPAGEVIDLTGLLRQDPKSPSPRKRGLVEGRLPVGIAESAIPAAAMPMLSTRMSRRPNVSTVRRITVSTPSAVNRLAATASTLARSTTGEGLEVS